MTLPNFLVIGAGRSGTTSLHHYLGQHPEVFVPEVKEPNFFAFEAGQLVVEDHYDAWLRQNSVTDRRAYEALFDAAAGATAIGEVSPQYLFAPRGAERIRSLIPEARLIAILRNPADRAYAAYVARYGNGWESCPDLRSAVREEERRTRDNRRLGIYNYRCRGNYAAQLERYYELFPREQVRVYVFEEFLRDPQVVLRDIFGFLGVDPDFRPDAETRHNPSGFIANPLLRSAWRRSATARELVRPFLPPRVRHAAFQWLRREVYKPPFPSDLRAELMDYYRADIAALERLLGRDLAIWLE